MAEGKIPDPEETFETSTGKAGHDPYAAWRVPAFRFYVIGSLLASVGANMQSVAVGWELYERTRSAMALGWVGLCQALPIMLLAMPAGQLADRHDRRRIVLISQCLMIACSLGLAAVSSARGEVIWMYALLFLGAIGQAFLWPANQALMPGLVPKSAFSNAVTWKSTGFQLACVSGPALGGFLIALRHAAAGVYVADAILGAANFFLLCAVPSPKSARAAASSSWRTLAEGFRYVWKTKVILGAITLDLFAVLLGGATALLPIYAKDILRVGPTGLGWLRSAPAIGACVIAVLLSHRAPMRRAGRAMLASVAVFGLATIVFGLSKSFWISMTMLWIAGAADMVSVVIRHSLVQLRTPDEMRGRVSAVNGVFISASNELGSFESGALAHFVGPIVSVVAGGIGTLIVVVLAALAWPELRRMKGLQE